MDFLSIHYNIEFICQEKYICNKTNNHECECNCEEEHKYKEIYIKLNNEYSCVIYKKYNISEIETHSSYDISNFSKPIHHNNHTYSEYYGCITAIKYKSIHNPIFENRKYLVNKKVINILNKYFKYEDEKIVCMYNNKKEIAKLTFITESDSWIGIFQSLELEISNKKFTFYVNRYKNPEKISKDSQFLVFHIINHNTRNKIILGYDPYENMYYKLPQYKILDDINQEIIKGINYEDQDFTHIYHLIIIIMV